MEEINVDHFPFWRKYEDQFDMAKLSDREVGILVRAMMRYQFNGEEPTNLKGVVRGLWPNIHDDLNYAKARYINAVQNGKKGGRKKKQPEETKNNPAKGNTESNTKSNTKSKSKTKSNTKSNTEKEESASAEAEVSVSKQTYGEFGWIRLTEQEYASLRSEMGDEQLMRCITYIDESAQTTGNRNHWLDWYTVLRRCYRKGWHELSHTSDKQQIPQGASGVLGDAEMEAIRRVLAT